jgi:glycolate oxidase FAD binding subunit
METGSSPQAVSIVDRIEEKMRSIVGGEHLRPANAADRVAGLQPTFVVEPGSEREVAAVLQAAKEMGVSVLPRGGGTKMDWGNAPSRADVILSTARLNKIIEHVWADLTVTVEAGCTVQTLQDALARHNQRLALDALWPKQATIGGILSTNDSGAFRLRFGSLRDLIIGVTVALPNGTLASSGGKVVKNVAGYDLPKLVTGAFGSLGVITRAVFRLHPLPRFARTFTCLARSFLPEAQRLVLSVQDSQLAHSALQVRCIEDSPEPKIDILFEGSEAGIAAQATAFKSLVASAPIVEADPPVWNARQELYSIAKSEPSTSTVAKFSTLPSAIESALGTLRSVAASHVGCDVVVQATGTGHVLLRGEPATVASALKGFRSELERNGGSLAVRQRPAELASLDAWGNAGDALPLMRAVKHQLDPRGTLNPGRFVGGI